MAMTITLSLIMCLIVFAQKKISPMQSYNKYVCWWQFLFVIGQLFFFLYNHLAKLIEIW
jgi:hypothetical protein